MLILTIYDILLIYSYNNKIIEEYDDQLRDSKKRINCVAQLQLLIRILNSIWVLKYKKLNPTCIKQDNLNIVTYEIMIVYSYEFLRFYYE
jgi:hypothetical protein